MPRRLSLTLRLAMAAATAAAALNAPAGAATDGDTPPASSAAQLPQGSAPSATAQGDLDLSGLRALTAPAAPLSLFQWALKTDGSLLLVPGEDGRLYPARRSEAGVIETLPIKIAVELYHDGSTRTLPLADIRAPQEITATGWILERRDGESWRPLAAMHFHDTTFYGQDAPGPFEPYALEDIRLSPR